MTRIRTTSQRNHDRATATMLSLLLVSRQGSPSEVYEFEFELTMRVLEGAKQGDC